MRMNLSTHRLAALAAVALLLGGCCFLRPFLRQAYLPVDYRAHPSVPSSWITPIQNAANTWNAIWPMFSFGGSTFAGRNAFDGINSISYAALADSRVLAVTYPLGITSNCELVDTDMVFNSNQNWSTTSSVPFGSFDVQSVALHEFGHYGVLHHVVCPDNSIMRPSIASGTAKRSITGCDALGMFVTNVEPSCWAITGFCFPSFFAQAAFEDVDDRDQPTVEPFGNHREELLQIWSGDMALRSDSDSLGQFYAPLLDDWRNGGSAAQSESFTWTRYNELNMKVLSRVYASASTDLRVDIDSVRSRLQGRVGSTLASVFSNDVETFNDVPPPSGDGGGGGEIEPPLRESVE